MSKNIWTDGVSLLMTKGTTCESYLHISPEQLKEIYRQIKVQRGRNILNCVEAQEKNIRDDFNPESVSDDLLEDIADTLDEILSSDTYLEEVNAVKTVLGNTMFEEVV